MEWWKILKWYKDNMSGSHTEQVEKLLKELEQADVGAKARHYGEVFAQLLEFSVFAKFLRNNFVFEYLIDADTGALQVQVRSIQSSDIDGPEAHFADAFNKVSGK